MGGSVELKLVYTSKVGTKTEVSKHLTANKKHIEGLVNNKFFKDDPEIAEWARSVIKLERESDDTAKGKRPYQEHNASTSGAGVKSWKKQPRVNGRFVKSDTVPPKGALTISVVAVKCHI